MKLLQNKSKKKDSRYAKRKARVNTQVKQQTFEARVLVNKSLNYVSAQLLLPSGDVVATVIDKGMTGANKTERSFAAGKELA
jgi:ribosomal protein L18